MEKRIGVAAARRSLGAVLRRVNDGEHVIVERAGKPVAAIVPITLYEQWLRRRERDFSVLDRIRHSVPPYPEDEVEADILAAVKEVRSMPTGTAREHSRDSADSV